MPDLTVHRAVPARVRDRVLALHEIGERPDDEYDVLRTMLEDVPDDARGRPWRQADLMLDVHFRRYPRRAVRRLDRMRAAHERRGELEKFARFWDTIRDLLGDVTLTMHGYSARLADRPRDELWREVGDIIDTISASGREAFVTSGTLLGLVRGDGVIDTDDDVDLAVLLEADNVEDAAQEWLALRRDWRAKGMLDTEYDDSGATHTKAASASGLKVDIFPGWLENERLYLWPYSCGDVASADVLPLTPLPTGTGPTLPGPAQPEALLATNYGENWRTPDPLFAFNWATAKERFGRFLELVQDAARAS